MDEAPRWTWIGLTRLNENTSVDINGDILSYENWTPGKPRKMYPNRSYPCAYMHAHNGEWFDNSCDAKVLCTACQVGK